MLELSKGPFVLRTYCADEQDKARAEISALFSAGELKAARGRLRVLAKGAPPADHDTGICSDLCRTCTPGAHHPRAYMLVGLLCVLLGYDSPYPLGKQRAPWAGEYGAARRQLCREMADKLNDFLPHNLKEQW